MNIIDFKTAAASKGKIIFLYLPCLWYFHDNYFGFGLVKDGSLRRFRVRKHQHEASQRESDEHLGHSDHDRDGGGYSAYFEYPVDKRLNRVEFNKPFGFWNWEIPKLAWMNRYSIMDQNWSILGSLVSYKSPIDPDMVFTGRVVARPKDQISPRLTCYGEYRVFVPEGHVWIESDLVGGKEDGFYQDSNLLGPIPIRSITGRIVALAPFSRIHNHITPEQANRTVYRGIDN